MIGKQFAHLNSPHREKALSYNIPIWFVLLTQQTKRSESMPRPDPIASDAAALIDAVIDREGRYVNHPADRGGAPCWGITEAAARAEGHAGAMLDLPRADAASLYRRLYWLRPGFDKVALRASKIAAELFDTGVNMGTATATGFLQRALNALNRAARDYPDVVIDRAIGPRPLPAPDGLLNEIGKAPWREEGWQ